MEERQSEEPLKAIPPHPNRGRSRPFTGAMVTNLPSRWHVISQPLARASMERWG